jgi:ABC-type branched-subunit amino acid transport system substrate-binding protein
MTIDRRSASIATVSLAIAAMLAAAPAFAQELPPRIKFGQLTALTGSAAVTGATAKPAAELAIKELNAAGGIGGRPVDLVIGDTATDPTQTVNEARRMVQNEKVHVVLGPEIGPFAMAAAPVLTEAKILSYPVTGANTITPQTYPYGFGTFYSADSFVMAMVDYAVDVLKATKIGVMHDSGAQGKSTVETFRSYVPKRGATITAMQEYEANAADLSPQALSLRRAGSEVIIQVVPTVQTGTLFKATEELGWNVPIINQAAAFVTAGTLGAGGPNVFKSGRVHSLGVKAGTYCPNDPLGASDYAKLLGRVKAAYPNEYAKMNLNTIPWIFDAVMLTKAAMEATKSVDGAVLAKWIEANGKAQKAITGPLAVSATYHLTFDQAIFAFLKDPSVLRDDGLTLRVGC